MSSPAASPTPVPATAPALDRIRIIDLTSIVFGPYATQILADYGADVIKVEAPEGDSTRRTGPEIEPGRAAIFMGVNRNKRSIVLDIKQPEGMRALLALVDTADVFVHSVRPQKLERIGLGAAALMKRNPRLIYAGLHGFGEGGPYAGQPAYDDIIQGMSGIADIVGRQSGTPRYFPTIAADKVCGQTAVHAILAALFQRERTGRGQAIEVPMFENMVSFVMVEHLYARHFAPVDPDTDVPQNMGYPRTLSEHRRPFRCADGWICAMPYNDSQWRRFFTCTGFAALADDPRFMSIAQRTIHIDALYAAMADILQTRSIAEWLPLLELNEIPAARVNRLEDLQDDPHLQAVGLFETLPGIDGVDYRFVRNPVRMASSSVAPQLPPKLGEHTRSILAELGWSDHEIDRLTT